MKFTIALTFFAAASALNLKEEESELEEALNLPVSEIGEFLECILEEEDIMLGDLPDAEVYRS